MYFYIYGFLHAQGSYHHVAYDIPVRMSKLAHQAGIPHCSLITASISNPNSWSQYVRIKGQIEASAQERFPHTSAFRAGQLNRGEDNRLIERIGCENVVCSMYSTELIRFGPGGILPSELIQGREL